MIRFLFIFIGLFSMSVYAQEINPIENFHPLQSGGKIPTYFLKTSTEIYEEAYKNNKNEKLDKEFFLSTRFFIHRLLLSGDILFNEEISLYVNKVGNKLLDSHTDLHGQITFYVIKSNTENAFSTDQGIVFITTGLISKLDNEAQLAFILAHEIMHYDKKHVRKGYIVQKDLENQSKSYKDLSYKELLRTISQYSKANEMEADIEGVKMLQQAGYNPNEALHALELLALYDLPFENRPFDKTYLNTTHLHIPNILFPDSVLQPDINLNEDDSLSTHPNIQKRITAIKPIVQKNSSKEGKINFFSKQSFEYMRDLARFESVYLDLITQNYVYALYKIYLLEKKYPDNSFLLKSKAHALYGLAKHKNHYSYENIRLSPKCAFGEIYPLAYFFSKISSQQISTIATRYLHDTKQKYPNDKRINKMYSDMLNELALYAKINPKDFSSLPWDKYKQELQVKNNFSIDDSLKKVENSDLSAFKKRKLKRALLKLKNEGKTLEYILAQNFYKSALYDLVAEQNLIEKLQAIQKNNSENQEETKKFTGISKTLILDPYFSQYNSGDKQNKVLSEKKQIKIHQSYVSSYKRLNLERKLISSKTLSENDVDKYNELGLLYDWFGEILSIADNNIDNFVSFSGNYTASFADKYNISNVLFSEIVIEKMPLLYSSPIIFLFPNLWLSAITELIIPKTYYEIFAFVGDLKSDKIVFYKSETKALNGSSYMLQAYIYNLLFELQKK